MPTRSTVALQIEDGGTWMHCTITNHSDDELNGHSYKKHIIKMGEVVMRTAVHMNQTPVSAEQYLRDQMAKDKDHFWNRGDIYRQ